VSLSTDQEQEEGVRGAMSGVCVCRTVKTIAALSPLTSSMSAMSLLHYLFISRSHIRGGSTLSRRRGGEFATLGFFAEKTKCRVDADKPVNMPVKPKSKTKKHPN